MRRGRRYLLSGALALVACLLLHAADARAAGNCGPGAIGTSRVIEVDTRGGPRLGAGHNVANQLQPGEIVLTFDDGPHKSLTPVILDTLDQHCAHATFFMVGQRALVYPALVREVARRGHTVATHTWSHRNLKQAGHDAGIAEIELGISAVQKALGAPAAPFFRFPYLSEPAYAQQHLRQRDTAMVNIDVDSSDYLTRSPSVVMRNVKTRLVAAGRRGIILFHDIQPSTAGALGALLTDLRADGYRVVHIVPKGQQTTLAEFDRRVGSHNPTLMAAAHPVPMDQRAVVKPGWEPRVIPMRETSPQGTPRVASMHVAQPRPPAPVAPTSERRPRRPDDAADWRTTVFRGW